LFLAVRRDFAMVTVILDDSQVSQIVTAAAPVELRDRQGVVLGTLVPGFSPDDIRRASVALADTSPRMTTAELLAHLDKLSRS
jgi:hypothetical protein